MFPEFDEKGKIFTQVITKEPVDVIIQTVSGQIDGKVHVRLDERLKDELDRTTGFLAVTDVTFLPNGHESASLKTAFMAVNIEHIIWVTPRDEVIKE